MSQLQLYVTLTNDFDKTFVLPLYNSFVKIELNSDNNIMLNTCNFKRKMLNRCNFE